MSHWLRVGFPVVCVNDEFIDEVYAILRERYRYVLPESLGRYTIREVLLFDFEGHPGEVSIRLVEIVNPSLRWSDGSLSELPFRASRFRPVINAERDLAQFEAILRGVETKREVVEA